MTEDPAPPAAAACPHLPDEQERATQAARSALARVQQAAQSLGFRPGHRPRRRPSRQVLEPRALGNREPLELSVGLARLVTDRGWQVDVSVGAVLGRWSRVVGAEVAAHCSPETFADGKLLVRADSTAWATQCRLLVPQLMRRLADELGPEVVLEIRVLGPSAPTWRHGLRRAIGPGPRDTYG